MLLSLIAAVSRNGVIGRDGALPWRLPADLKHFKKLTLGKPVIMGRKTWESIGRPLPGRLNIVLTRSPIIVPPGILVAGSLAQALELAKPAAEVFVIGGRAVYAEALPHAHRLYLTHVDAEIAGDTTFPEWQKSQWKLVEWVDSKEDTGNMYAMRFATYERNNPLEI